MVEGDNARAMYEVLRRRGIVPDLTFDEFYKAALEVVETIPVEAVTPIEEMIVQLELRVLANRSLN